MAYMGWTINSMTFTKRNFGILGAAIVLNKIIDKIPPKIKEKFRIKKGLKLAD